MAERFHDRYLAPLRQALAEVVVDPDGDVVGTAARVIGEQATEIARLNTLLEPKRAGIRALVEASSLGAPDAVAVRAACPDGLAEAAVQRAAELGGPQAAALAREAEVSAALGHDPRAQTISLPTDDEDDGIDWDDDEPAPVEPLHTMDREAPIAVTPARPAPSNEEIRAWCRANGVAVSTKGQISGRARAAYDAAHQIMSSPGT
jgi:hypothetical protein